MTIIRICFVLMALALPARSAICAESLGKATKEEREACAPEAVKFCKHELDLDSSDNVAILKCLQKNRQQISTRCQAALQAHGK
jgi:hypothetical protein